MKEILIIVGTRPNFIKVTQFKKVAKKFPNLNFNIVHTGQHFDAKMADIFFEQFNLTPDIYLNIPPSSANTQMANIMLKLEDVIAKNKPALMIVVGDVNSTLAAALTANKLGVKIAHLESGLRSFDNTMPEEHNRILTDAITDIFFVTEQSGMDHLFAEGKNKNNIYFVGNTMIDTMVAFETDIEKSNILTSLNIQKKEFILMTMHRPATVDNIDGLKQLIDLINKITPQIKIVFPVHPRTVKNLETHQLLADLKNNSQLIFTEPLDYFSFQKLVKESKLIITDSGGIQEESTFLQVPCITLRPNTERPSTVTIGSNELMPFDTIAILNKITTILNGQFKKGNIPPLWDGNATSRIVEIIDQII